MNISFDLVIRPVAVYLFIVLALRLFGKKELAQLSVIDLVFILLISNAVQNAMVGSNSSLVGGLIAAGILFLTNYVLKKLIYYFKPIDKLLQGEPTLLIYEGEIQEKQLKKVGFTIDELSAAVREHGVKSIEEVNLAMLEVDGNISVLSGNYRNHTKKHRLHQTLSQMR